MRARPLGLQVKTDGVVGPAEQNTGQAVPPYRLATVMNTRNTGPQDRCERGFGRNAARMHDAVTPATMVLTALASASGVACNLDNAVLQPVTLARQMIWRPAPAS